MKKTTTEVADEVVSRVKQAGVSVLRYDSVAYGSVYLKFDYGMGNSLRIADHESKKKHLKYRYNLLMDCERMYMVEDKYDRFYYGPRHIDRLVSDILDNILQRKDFYGLTDYYMQVNKMIRDNQQNLFWKKAREV